MTYEFEVLYLFNDYGWVDYEGNPLFSGWYYWWKPRDNRPGSSPIGPFRTAALAKADAEADLAEFSEIETLGRGMP